MCFVWVILVVAVLAGLDGAAGEGARLRGRPWHALPAAAARSWGSREGAAAPALIETRRTLAAPACAPLQTTRWRLDCTCTSTFQPPWAPAPQPLRAACWRATRRCGTGRPGGAWLLLLHTLCHPLGSLCMRSTCCRRGATCVSVIARRRAQPAGTAPADNDIIPPLLSVFLPPCSRACGSQRSGARCATAAPCWPWHPRARRGLS